MQNVTVVFDKSNTAKNGLRLCPDVNLYTGKREFIEKFGEVTSLEEDLLVLGAAIFAADLASKRGQQHNFVRQIDLTVPVVNLPSFLNVAEDITYALNVLSADAWKIHFTQKEGQPERTRKWEPQQIGKVLLFSGGLDSFAAAVSLAEKSKQIQLVSHVTANQVITGTQDNLAKHLNETYAKKFSRISFRVTGIGKPTKGFTFPQDKEREETQRTRSFMFLCLAGLVARRQGCRDVVMIAENGQMAIHLPLSAGRISAFSTHTAHPEFVVLMSSILSKLLNHKINIDNPFLYKTKAEVVKLLLPRHQAILEKTVSCWKASRVSHYHHCGICIPCLIRRIALESNSISLQEYEKDILRSNVALLDPNDDGKRNLVELCEFVNNFKSDHSMAELQLLFPELAASDCYDPNQAVKMYKRFAVEAQGVFKRYPEVIKLIG